MIIFRQHNFRQPGPHKGLCPTSRNADGVAQAIDCPARPKDRRRDIRACCEGNRENYGRFLMVAVLTEAIEFGDSDRAASNQMNLQNT